MYYKTTYLTIAFQALVQHGVTCGAVEGAMGSARGERDGASHPRHGNRGRGPRPSH